MSSSTCSRTSQATMVSHRPRGTVPLVALSPRSLQIRTAESDISIPAESFDNSERKSPRPQPKSRTFFPFSFFASDFQKGSSRASRLFHSEFQYFRVFLFTEVRCLASRLSKVM